MALASPWPHIALKLYEGLTNTTHTDRTLTRTTKPPTATPSSHKFPPALSQSLPLWARRQKVQWCSTVFSLARSLMWWTRVLRIVKPWRTTTDKPSHLNTWCKFPTGFKICNFRLETSVNWNQLHHCKRKGTISVTPVAGWLNKWFWRAVKQREQLRFCQRRLKLPLCQSKIRKLRDFPSGRVRETKALLASRTSTNN